MTQDEFRKVKFEERESGYWLRDVPVIEYWEKEMMEKSVQEITKRIHPRTVLEFGYGLGYSAKMWDHMGLTTHVIIEPNEEILKEARKWAGPNRILIEDFAQNITLPYTFDLIYDDLHDFTNSLAIEYPWNEKLRFYWYSRMPQPVDNPDPLDGFIFDWNGKPYHQVLHRNEQLWHSSPRA